ncbi:PAS domain S-box protein [Polaribacter sp.]
MSVIDINCTDFFNLNPLPSWIYDITTFQILEVNTAAIELYGYSKKEFLSLTLKDLLPKKDSLKLDDSLKNIDSIEGKIHFGILSHQKKNGNLIQMDIVGHKVNFNNKKCILNISQDVTEKQIQLTKLKKTEEQFKAAANIAKLGYWRLDLFTNTISWTEEVSQIWGGKNEKKQLNLEGVLSTIHPNDLENLLQRYEKSITEDGLHDAIHRIILPDSSVKWVHEIASVKIDENGIPISLEGTVQDITERKEEEERLRLLENVITNTNDVIVITEAEPIENTGPKIIYVNKAFTEMTGYSAEEIIGKTPRILQGPNTDKNELEKLKSALKKWEPCEVTLLNNKKNGDEFWVKLSVTPITNETGTYTNWISIQRDVTVEKQNQLKKDLLAKISNNFKNESSLVSSTKKVCQTICDFGNFDFAEIWLPNLDKTRINFISKIANSKIAEKFYESSIDVTSLHPQEGIPGIVWQKKSSILCSNVSKNLDFVRKDAAKNSGINTALGIPLLFSNEVNGVLMIGTKNNSSCLKNHQKTLEDLKDFIGSEINRKKLENDLNHLYDAVPDLICVTDLNGKFLKINKAGCEIIGYQEDEILHYNYEKFIHPEDKNISNSDLENLNKGNNTINFQNRFIKKNGEIVWLSWTSNVNLEEGLIYASAKNITEEIKLLDLTTQTSKLARIGSWEVDLINNQLFWSDIAYEIHETSKTDFIPSVETAINFYRKDFQDLISYRVQDCIKNGKPYDFEAVLITAKNNEIWIRTHGSAEIINGKTVRIYGSIQNINQQKLNEIALNESLKNIEDYKFALDQSASITITDPNGIIKYVNDSFCKLSKYSREELIGKTHQIINSKYHSKAFFKELWNTITKGKVWKGEIKNKAKDGNYYWALSTIVPFLDSKNNPFQFMAIRIDITEKKLADEKAISVLNEKNKILESIGDAFFAIDKKWIVTYWNKEAEAIIGVKREEIIGFNFWKIFNKGINFNLYKKLKKTIETKKNLNTELYSNDLKKWLEINAYPSNGGLSVYFKDITLRKEADLKLLEANERFEKVSEATSDAIYEWGIIDDTHYWGAGFETILGYDLKTEKPSSKLWLDHVHPDDVERVKKSVFDAIDNPNIMKWAEEYRFIKKTGEELFVIDRGIFLRNNNLKAEKMFGSISDLTQLKNQELELITLNNSLKKYAKELELTNQ